MLPLPLHSTGPEKPVNTERVYQIPKVRVTYHLLLLVDTVDEGILVAPMGHGCHLRTEEPERHVGLNEKAKKKNKIK